MVQPIPRGHLNNRNVRPIVTRKNTSLPPTNGLVDQFNFSGTVGTTESRFVNSFNRTNTITSARSRWQVYEIPAFAGGNNTMSITNPVITKLNTLLPPLVTVGVGAFSFYSLTSYGSLLSNAGKDYTIYDKTSSVNSQSQTRFGTRIQGVYGAFNNYNSPSYASPSYTETDEVSLFTPLQGGVAYKSLFPSASYRFAYYPYGVTPNTIFQYQYPTGFPSLPQNYNFSNASIKPIVATVQTLKSRGVVSTFKGFTNGLLQGGTTMRILPFRQKDFLLNIRTGETLVKLVYGKEQTFLESILAQQFVNRESRISIKS